jgi:hypothetical protein
MGRPLNKRLFGADSNNNIKVQFYNGTASVPGYIVRQKSNLKFLCEDADGNQAVCKLVNTSSANLTVGEMSITVKYDDNTVRQIVKIAKNLVTVNYDYADPALFSGQTTTGFAQAGWTFSTSNSDRKWQIEEAGNSTSTISVDTGATDLEGDDGPYLPFGMKPDEPYIGSGGSTSTVPGLEYLTAIETNMGSYALKGTAYDPGGSTATVANMVAGTWRNKYVGEWMTSADSTATWNMNFFTTSTVISTDARSVDTYMSFGGRTDLGYEDGYSLEWKGYLQVPQSGNWNTYLDVDDEVIMWVGAAAINPTTTNWHHKGKYNNAGQPSANVNTLILSSGTYYPVRLRFVEYGGAERMQVFMNTNSTSTQYNGLDLTWAHNSVTKGY